MKGDKVNINKKHLRHRSQSCRLCLVSLFVILVSTVSAMALTPVKKRAKRQKGERIVLVHADRLHYDIMKNPNANILNGNVEFLHGNIKLYCDSAYYYKASNSFASLIAFAIK